MSRTSDVYRARAAALRNDARYHIGVARARLLARAESCERMAAALERHHPRPAAPPALVAVPGGH